MKDIVWRIYNKTDKGQRGAHLLGTVNASTKEEAEAKAAQGSFRMRMEALATNTTEFFAHV